MHYLFLDSNIYLDFYRFGKDDLDQIEKIVALIEGEEISLITNEHLQAELRRNRDKVAAQSIEELKQKINFRTPRLCEGISEVDEIKAKIKSANELLVTLQKDLEEKAISHKLRPDLLIKRLIALSEQIPVDNQIVDQAIRRVWMGTPPGKQGSIGDALHWSTLLNHECYNLHLVTRDGDFRSALNGTTISGFLLDEWKKEKSLHANVTLHSSLSQFLLANFPSIKLSDEATKAALIDQLSASTNFASTHAIIDQLSKFDFYTSKQIGKLFEVLVENDQVGSIATDADVKTFYTNFNGKTLGVSFAIQEKSAKLLNVNHDTFFIPF